MLRNRGITLRLVLFFSLIGSVVFVLIVAYNYYFSRRIIEQKVEENARNLAVSSANRIEAVLRPVQKIPENLAYFLENDTYGEKEIFQLLYDVVTKNKEIYGAGIAFEPRAFKRDAVHYAPYFYRPGSYVAIKYLDEHYDYFMWDWYQIPRELGTPEWTEPYFGEGGEIVMSSYSVPFYRTVDGKRQLRGVVCVDISLDWLAEIISSIRILNTGFGFLITENGAFVYHPQKSLIMNHTIFSAAEETGNTTIKEIGRRMVRGESGFMPFKDPLSGRNSYVFYAPIRSNGWSLGVVFPVNELDADIIGLNKIVVLLGLLGIVLLCVTALLVSRSITGPLRAMAGAASRIATGNLDAPVPEVASGDEVGKLAQALHFMQDSLKGYIGQVAAAAAEKERVDSELRIASEIQMSILPKSFRTQYTGGRLDVSASIKPAREVGGDFYDFFDLDDENVCAVIADVSGKGVPAALFMAVTKTLVKAKAGAMTDPAEIIAAVNDELAQENELTMFVTIFCAVLHVPSGRLLYVSGGHNPPAIVRPGSGIRFVREPQGLVVGAMEGVGYRGGELLMERGDGLFLYTDGVVEAQNERGEFYGDDRMRVVLERCSGMSAESLTNAVLESLSAFTEGAEQSDDITMLALRYLGSSDDG
jgi:sigma-B regulation protein RsbU (phosphoserine phosphatase)